MCYEQEEIELDPGFNSFVGISDSGKSTILRALIWVFFNRPTGMEMCRTGTSETRVQLTLDDGNIIEKIRSKNRNAYSLTTPTRNPTLRNC